MKKYFRVSTIRSRRAVEREGLEHPSIVDHIGDFYTLHAAQDAYKTVPVGTEVDKQIELINEGDGEAVIIETTY